MTQMSSRRAAGTPPLDLQNQLAAAEAGKAEALYTLGLIYAGGQGVRPDKISAHKWLNLAARYGVAEAVRDRAELARDMSIDQCEEAQRQARLWLASHPGLPERANDSASA